MVLYWLASSRSSRREKMIKTIKKWWKESTCDHDWIMKTVHAPYEEIWFECLKCGKQREV